MKVLVTGAEGFIGSHLTEQLLKNGHSVNALVQYNSFASRGWLANIDETLVANLSVHFGDIRDEASMREAFTGVQIVFHLAALIAIPYSYIAPRSYIETNVIGTLNILQLAREFKVDRLIHTSTSEVYGTSQFEKMNELHPLVAQSPYAASKIGADQLVEAFNRSFGLPTVILRPFNTFGPRQSLRAVIPSIIRQSIQSKTIKIGALQTSRDFSYIEDTVNGFILASRAKLAIGETINLGTGEEFSIAAVIGSISELLGKKLEVIEEISRLRPEASEVNRLCSDNTKAFELIGWAPKNVGLSGLNSGLELTIKWMENPTNLKFYSDDGYIK